MGAAGLVQLLEGVGVESRGGGPDRYRPGAPSALMQIVPNLSSFYTLFYSVIYNSVRLPKKKQKKIVNLLKRTFINAHNLNVMIRRAGHRTIF